MTFSYLSILSPGYISTICWFVMCVLLGFYEVFKVPIQFFDNTKTSYLLIPSFQPLQVFTWPMCLLSYLTYYRNYPLFQSTILITEKTSDMNEKDIAVLEIDTQAMTVSILSYVEYIYHPKTNIHTLPETYDSSFPYMTILNRMASLNLTTLSGSICFFLFYRYFGLLYLAVYRFLYFMSVQIIHSIELTSA